MKHRAWQPLGDGRFELAPRANLAAPAAHGAAIRITADSSRLAVMLDAIDWDGLASAFPDQ